MSAETSHASTGRVIVVGNEKGGSGKSTVAMHVAIALLKRGHRVATIDLDSQQQTFTHYIESRQSWAQHIGRDLEMPDHHRFEQSTDYPTAEDQAAETRALTDAIEAMTRLYNFVVIDTPGHSTHLGRLAHSMADTLITPLNDSFVDLDVLGTVDAATLTVTGPSHYSQMVVEAREQRADKGLPATDWVVLRNRLSMLSSRNKRCVGEGLAALASMLDFRFVDALADRVIFREYYPRGVTALDTLDPVVLGTRPTLSHATARHEVDALIAALNLDTPAQAGDLARDAA